MRSINKKVYSALQEQHAFDLLTRETPGSELVEITLEEKRIYELMLRAELKGSSFNSYLNKIIEGKLCTIENEK
jgi:hypothetical protein